METHYWKPTVEEAEMFKTYTFEKCDFTEQIERFYKKSLPSFCNVPSEISHIIKQQEEYFALSNREDIHVLEKEKEAFIIFYHKEVNEINDAIELEN